MLRFQSLLMLSFGDGGICNLHLRDSSALLQQQSPHPPHLSSTPLHSTPLHSTPLHSTPQPLPIQLHCSAKLRVKLHCRWQYEVHVSTQCPNYLLTLVVCHLDMPVIFEWHDILKTLFWNIVFKLAYFDFAPTWKPLSVRCSQFCRMWPSIFNESKAWFQCFLLSFLCASSNQPPTAAAVKKNDTSSPSELESITIHWYRAPFKFIPPSGAKWKPYPSDWWHRVSCCLLQMQKQVVTSRECKTIELETSCELGGWRADLYWSHVCLYSHIVLDQMCVGWGDGGAKKKKKKEEKKSLHYKL